MAINKNALFGPGWVVALALLGGCLTDGQATPGQHLVASKVAECPDPRPRVAVAGFDAAAQDVPAEVGPGLADLLVAAMTETGCYRMVDSSVLAKFADAGGHAPDLARLAGADLFVVGRVTAFEPDAAGADVGVANGPKLPEWLRSAGFNVASSRISLALRLVDTRSGEVRGGLDAHRQRSGSGRQARGKPVRPEPCRLRQDAHGGGHAGGDRPGGDLPARPHANRDHGLSAGRGGSTAIAAAADRACPSRTRSRPRPRGQPASDRAQSRPPGGRLWRGLL